MGIDRNLKATVLYATMSETTGAPIVRQQDAKLTTAARACGIQGSTLIGAFIVADDTAPMIVAKLAESSICFNVDPLPDGQLQVAVKREVLHIAADLIHKLCNQAKG